MSSTMFSSPVGTMMVPGSMKPSSPTKVGILYSLLALSGMALGSTLTPPDQTIRSCTESTCGNCNTGNSGNSLGNNIWRAEKAFPECQKYSAAYFKGTEIPGTQGYSVFWDIGQPQPGCKVLVMSPVAVSFPYGCGKVVVQATNAGCYPSVMEESFMVQTCCGSACQEAGALGKRSPDGKNERWTLVPQGAKLLGTFNLTDNEASTAPRTSSAFLLGARAAQPDVRKDAAAISPDTPTIIKVKPLIRGSQLASLKRADPKLHKKNEEWSCRPAESVGNSWRVGFPPHKASSVLSCNNVDGQPCEHMLLRNLNLSNVLFTVGTPTGLINLPVNSNLFNLRGATTTEVNWKEAILTATGLTHNPVELNIAATSLQAPAGTKSYAQFIPYAQCGSKNVWCSHYSEKTSTQYQFHYCEAEKTGDGYSAGELSLVSV